MLQPHIDLERVHALHATDRLAPEGHRAAVAALTRTPPADVWLSWLRAVALGLGVVNVTGGVVHFLAVNWTVFGFWGQLAGMLALVAGATVGSAWFGHRLPGWLAASVAAFTIGPTLVLITSEMETRGSMAGLLLLWCVLMLPYLLWSRFGPLFLFWLATLWVAWMTHLDSLQAPGQLPLLGCAALALGALFGWDALAGGLSEGRPRWLPRVLGVVGVSAIGLLAVPALWMRLELLPVTAMLTAVALVPVMQVAYWRGGRDLLLAAAPLMTAIAMGASVGLRVASWVLPDDFVVLLGLPIIGTGILLASGVCLAWLRAGTLQGGEA